MPVEARAEGVDFDVDGLVSDAERLCAHVDAADQELSLVVCDDTFIRALNLQWRQHDAPTDVLSFPLESDALLGDVVISLPTAARQAAERGHALDRELRVLLVHGFLHLLGYDHHDAEATAEMREAEARLLRDALGEDPEGLVERAGA